MEGGLYINGEKCPKDQMLNGGNILVTYDTLSSRLLSPETVTSTSESDVIILDNGIGGQNSPLLEGEHSQFTRNLRGLKTPSPRAIVTQWLQTSPVCKTPERMRIVIERTVDDKGENTSKSKAPSTFEIFDLGANRINKTPTGEIPVGSGGSAHNPMSPETCRKQELCSYLQLMNMNSKSDKQRSKLRANFNRRSNRVKNLIVQIEKRKLEERINKIDLNSSEDSKIVQHILSLRRNAILNGQAASVATKDFKSLPEAPEGNAILQGFTPSLMPTQVSKRKVAFDIVMHRFITDENITIKRRKLHESNNSDEARSDVTSKTTRQRLKLRKLKTLTRSPENADKSEITYLKEKPNTSIKTSTLKKTKNLKRKIRRKYIKKSAGTKNGGATLFEMEINKINRRNRCNGRNKFHNLRVKQKLLKHKENLPNKTNNKGKLKRIKSLVENVLKAKQGKLPPYRNNGINNDARIKQDYRKSSQVVINSKKNKENMLDLKFFQEKQTEIVDLSENHKEIKRPQKNVSSVEKKETTPSIVEESISTNKEINPSEVIEEAEKSNYLSDHTYAEKENLVVLSQHLNFRGFTLDEQIISNRVFSLVSEISLVLGNKRTITKRTTINEADFDVVEHEASDHFDSDELILENNQIDAITKETDNCGIKELDLNDELIRYNMHDYFVPERFNHFSDSSSSSVQDDSSDSSSIYSEISHESIKDNTVDSTEVIKVLAENTKVLVAKIKPNVLKPEKILALQAESALEFARQSDQMRSMTPPTYIPFLAKDRSPSKTLHRNLTNNNRRKASLLNSSYNQQDNVVSTTSSKSSPCNSNNTNHCASLAASNGVLLHAEYCAGQLVASQERLITCWAQTPLGDILHSQELWFARGTVVRQQFSDSVLKSMKNRIMIVDNEVTYVEIWIKEHKSVFRERPVADVFAVLYTWKTNHTVEKKLIQLENIKGSADDVQCIILNKSRSILVSWSVMQSTIKQATVLHLYEISPDYQRVLTIKELKSIGTKIQSLHTIDDSDDLVLGSGENCVNIWNVENGYIAATLEMPDTLPEPKCLWTLCNQGFVFLLQECNDGLLRLIAINGMKLKITWKNLKIFNPPKEYCNLQGVSLENGILISCYENGILSWNVQTSELLTEEPLLTEDKTSSSAPSCFLSDSHLVQLERNGQIHVRHVLYHLLTSSDLSM